MHLQNLLATFHVWCVDLDLTVESTRSKQSRVQDVGSVGCCNQNHIGLGIKTVHLDKKLIQGLFALVVTAAHSSATVSTDGVNLVDEDDRRRVFFGLSEEVTHTRSSHTNEHFHEVGAGDRIEGHVRLTGHSTREKGFSCSRRAIEQHTLRDSGAHLLELLGVLQEFLNLMKLLDSLIRAGHVLEGDRWGFLRHKLRSRLAKLHDARAATLHAGEKEPENQTDDDEGKN